MNKEQAQEIIKQMAKAGYERMFDGKWDELHENAIDRALWYEVARAMLGSVKFPADLYHVCRMIFMRELDKTKEECV